MHDLYLFYGATFFTVGVLLAFQARLPQSVLPRSALWWLAGFAMVHGLSEWAQMDSLVSDDREVAELELVSLALGFVSFVLLAQFALVVIAALRRWPRWLLLLPAALAIVWSAVATTVAAPNGLNEAWLRDIEAMTRHAFALPASLLTAWALWLVRSDRREQDSIGRHLGFASAAFVAYGIVAGAIVPPGSVFPASYPSSETFLSATRMPVAILRMACAACISMFLSEALVIQAARERDELERRREEFISIVAHDLRSPIAVIDMGAELLERHIGGIEGIDPQRTSRFLQNIKTSARGLERMVRDLLDASRIETSTVALELRDVELRSLIGGIVDRAGEATRGHRVIAALPESLPMVRADPLRLEQVLVNLLSNAAKYSEPDAAITVEAIVRDDEVEIAVTNPGTGLSQQEIGKVFSRFYRSAQHVRRADGLGLGLYIVRGLVEAQGGRVWVDSEVGRYATFRFTVPRSSVGPEVAAPTVAGS